MKLLNKIITIILGIVLVSTSFVNVKAASDSIQLGGASKVGSYIAGVSFSYKVTTDGRYLYCLDLKHKTAENVRATLVKNSKYVDAGLLHILKNGYPNKSITGDKDKDYYITQTAVWWYLDNTTGSTNLGNMFKQKGSDSYNIRGYVQKLVDEGVKHRGDSMNIKDTTLTLSSVNGNTMTLQGDYYVSNNIKASSENIGTYTVSLENAPAGTKIVSSNGTEAVYQKEFTVGANDSFKIKVLKTKITDVISNIKVNATAIGYDQYMAYEYKPVDSSMQNVALLEKISKKVSASLNLTIDSPRVTIVKVDAKTKKALAGAKLVLKDSNGKEITRWTSTINAHIIRNLANGKYTIEEIEAPKGYRLNKNKTSFVVDGKNRDIKITIENAPKSVVVNIVKVDQETNQPLMGAVLVIKNKQGVEILRFTTGEDPYVLTDLEDGVYTVEELSAPEGYIKSDEVITFTIDDDHQSHQIIFKNAKEVIVPDTGASSTILFILGIAILTIGVGYIHKNAKEV